MKNKQAQQKLYNNIDTPIKRSLMNLSFNNAFTANFGKIYPSLCKKTLPGDSLHLKTSYFTRWLSQSAPTFNKLDISFLNFFVPNTLIWGGWEQFQGMGDNKSAEYLNPGTIANLTNFEIPHFTTRNIADWLYMKYIQIYTIRHGEGADEVGFAYPCLTDVFKRYYYLVLLPLVTEPYRSNSHDNGSNASISSAGPTYTYATRVKYGIMLVRKSEFWDDCFRKSYAFNLSDRIQDNETRVLQIFQQQQANLNVAFVCKGFNPKYYPEGYEVVEIPYNSYIIDCNHFIPQHSDIGGMQFISPASDSLSYRTKNWTRIIGGFYDIEIIESTIEGFFGLSLDYSNMSIVSGYLFDYPIEEDNPESGVMSFSVADAYYRTIGQDIISQLFGAKTLSDYLGKCYAQSLLRQPFSIANVILGYVEKALVKVPVSVDRLGYDIYQNNYYLGKPLGTYNENSDLVEIGIINDSPITFLQYLAYQKCWSDYLRDKRFEMQSFYSNPYRSPFLIPMNNDGNEGNFINGNVFSSAIADSIWNVERGMIYWNDNDLNNPNYIFNDNALDGVNQLIQRKLMPSKPFSIDSFIQLISFREKRIVQDFFTLVNPTAEYGEAQGVDVEMDMMEVSQGSSPVTSTQVYRFTDGSFGSGGTTRYKMIDTIMVSALRLATRMQKFLERSNFPSSDYVGEILTRWGVKVQHCQHCEVRYLGGDKFTPKTNPITMVGAATENQTTGQQTGQLTSSGNCGKVDYKTNEHGFFMQLCYITNDFVSPDGVEKDELTYFDYPLPEFADLGPEGLPIQRVVNVDGTTNTAGIVTNPMKIFGYIPRYAQWKCSLNEVHGDFRKNLSYWITKRKFNPNLLNGSFGLGKVGNLPEIGKNFLYENPDYNSFDYNGEDFDHCFFDVDQFFEVSRELPMLPNPRVI